jgi:transglutaminase-like putative cysteine protease
MKAKIYATEYFIYPDKVGSIEDIPQDIREKYTQDGDKYRVSDPYIKKLAAKIAGDERNPYWIARRVFDFLGKHLSYNLKPLGGWNPAPTVLKRGTASCSEYSYSMIALCRALGVPIRYVGAVSRRGDDASIDEVYHRWTEVYLPPYGWIPFDANKGDTNRPGGGVLGIGNVDARYIITTENGGGDEYLWFGYNYNFKWTSEGKCRIYEETYGLWSPWSEKKYHKPLKEKNK